MNAHAPLPPAFIDFVNPPGLHDPTPSGYSHVVISHLPARVVHIAGQGGGDASNGTLSPDFATQVDQALTNLRRALQAADADIADVVKITVLVVDYDMERLRIFTRAWSALLGNWPPPASTLIPVPRLALDGMLFEIDAVAVLPPTR